MNLLVGRVKPIKVTLYPAQLELEFAHLTTNPDDIHVLAAAYYANVDVLVSPDRKHVVTEKIKEKFPIPVVHTIEFFHLYSELKSNQYRVNTWIG